MQVSGPVGFSYRSGKPTGSTRRASALPRRQPTGENSPGMGTGNHPEAVSKLAPEEPGCIGTATGYLAQGKLGGGWMQPR